ncbi:MAG: hypothetical protein ISS19_14375 [Bacteroidales bacterium]|nr:hypothetical protein [Bacteroidales bacterium]
MKRIAILFILTIFISPAFGQDDDIQTLFGDGFVTHGGYGSFSVGYSQIDGKDALTMGGRGAWIIGHWFALGFAGTGFLNDYHFNNDLSRNANLSGGYGGLLMEPILLPKFPIHISLPLVVGVGGIAYTTSYSYTDWDDPRFFAEDATSFLVVEPGVELEFNVVKFFRLAVGGYYRYTSKITLYDTPEDVLNGFSGGITLKFGKF